MQSLSRRVLLAALWVSTILSLTTQSFAQSKASQVMLENRLRETISRRENARRILMGIHENPVGFLAPLSILSVAVFFALDPPTFLDPKISDVVNFLDNEYKKDLEIQAGLLTTFSHRIGITDPEDLSLDYGPPLVKLTAMELRLLKKVEKSRKKDVAFLKKLATQETAAQEKMDVLERQEKLIGMALWVIAEQENFYRFLLNKEAQAAIFQERPGIPIFPLN